MNRFGPDLQRSGSLQRAYKELRAEEQPGPVIRKGERFGVHGANDAGLLSSG